MSDIKLTIAKSEVENSSAAGEFIEYKELYPRPLPDLDLNTMPDSTGFTLLEKATLRNFLRLFERQQHQISRIFFVDFFTEFEYLIESFRSKNGKLNIQSLTHHTIWVQQLITDLITIGLQSKGHLDKILQNCIICHHAHLIDLDDINLYASQFDQNLSKWYQHMMSPTLLKGFEKIWALIRDAHEDNARRSSTFPVNFDDF